MAAARGRGRGVLFEDGLGLGGLLREPSRIHREKWAQALRVIFFYVLRMNFEISVILTNNVCDYEVAVIH